ncbi:tetratricopeptide repeat protein [Phytobacter ursingii]
MSFIRPALCALVLLPCLAHADDSDKALAAECAKVPGYVQQGEAAYKARQYAKAQDAFVLQVAWGETCRLDDKFLATAYNNVALTLIRLGDYRKASAWLSIAPDDPKSIYNLGLIKDKLAALPVPASPAGVYWQYAGMGAWNTLTLKAEKTANFYKADFEGYYFGMMGLWSGPNMGEFSEPVQLKENKGVIALRDEDYIHCDISLAVVPNGLDLQTDQPEQCGFGHNVSASGHYMRVE